MEPATEAELAQAVAGAAGPLCIRGGGTRGVSGTGEALSVAGLRGVELYEPGALTLVVRAGTPVAEVETMLAGEGQRLPFEPMDMRAVLGTNGVPTIGGVVASNASGPRRIQAGACRDSLIGVRFVDGRGDVIKNGGRVMKNVTGYDLVKLMAGSHGTLGVLSEVSFKLLPAPEVAACVLIEGLSDADAVAALSAALGSPFEVSGAAHLPVGLDGAPVTMIRVEGFAASVAYRAGRLQALLARFGDSVVEDDPARVAAGWAWVRDVQAFADLPGDVWRVSVKPSDGPRVVAAVGPRRAVYDWGGGLVWLLVAEGRDIRPGLAGIAGHATLIRAGAETRARIARFHPEAPPVAALSAGLRARFDPRGILNPGVMG
ncbi:FAD-binding protein [Actibacterium sp. XHP0104]|uniref:FAD-binding protein n=1 Tax=Actibacterium sp. XHP0104 TaxID=2984335 RepID=UPI0021E7F926|nr:FAD-binding protein [Actibacterium sp. XHP0104]MCV2882326.1 FAD-binding protein [Actibacterium sp. XHP0104]